jgi:23S rRNA pseudouridine1911/1915/1917 synthase
VTSEPDSGPNDDLEGDVDDEREGSDECHRIIAAKPGRLDAVVASALAALSRAHVQRLIEQGRVTHNGVVAAKSGEKVRVGDRIELQIPPPEPLEVIAEPIPLVILFEDREVIVIDKPAGMVVHPSAGHATGTLVNALLYHCSDLSGIGGMRRPGIVHRLDKGTTGVMVAAKTDRAHASLAAQFAAKSRGEPGGIERAYLAIVSPPPDGPNGTLRTAFGRHPVHRKQFSSKVGSGRSAVSHWHVVQSLHRSAIVQFVLETGRTHQIRVHAADHGFPLVGDAVYGHKLRDPILADVARALGRPALHAMTLAFAHPTTGEHMRFEAALPPDFVSARLALATT